MPDGDVFMRAARVATSLKRAFSACRCFMKSKYSSFVSWKSGFVGPKRSERASRERGMTPLEGLSGRPGYDAVGYGFTVEGSGGERSGIRPVSAPVKQEEYAKEFPVGLPSAGWSLEAKTAESVGE